MTTFLLPSPSPPPYQTARESFPQTEKHVHSARALMTFASSEEGGPISLEVAMQRLDKLAVECLSGLSAPDGYVAR